LKNLKISHFDPMRLRGSISTSAIHFIISKTVSGVTADAAEVPKTKSSSTNGLAAIQGGKVHPNFENQKKNFRKKIFMLHYNQKNMLNPLVKSFFKSVDN